MSDFQKSFSESTSSIKFDEKYIDTSVQPNDIGVAEQWAVKTVADPCVGNLATPVNSGYFTKAFINNLPFYREGISPNFRGLETGAAFGYLLYGPFTMTGPLRNSEFALTAGLLATIGAVHILTALLFYTMHLVKHLMFNLQMRLLIIRQRTYLQELVGLILQVDFG